MTNREMIATSMVRSFSDKHLMQRYDELTAELAQRETYETKYALEIVRKEILRRMDARPSEERSAK